MALLGKDTILIGLVAVCPRQGLGSGLYLYLYRMTLFGRLSTRFY
jgi:hypothetical protein